MNDLIERLRKMARCIYIAVEATVADDVSDGLTKAADTIESQASLINKLGEALERNRRRFVTLSATAVMNGDTALEAKFDEWTDDTAEALASLKSHGLDTGRSPSGPGYSAEPEPVPVSAASAVSIPNAERGA